MVRGGKRSDENDVSRRQGARAREHSCYVNTFLCPRQWRRRRPKCGSIANEAAIVVLFDFFDFSVSAVRVVCRLSSSMYATKLTNVHITPRNRLLP